MAAPIFTADELAFIKRMAPHIERGASLEGAARAVLADDQRLWLAAVLDTPVGRAIRDDMGARVYAKLRGA